MRKLHGSDMGARSEWWADMLARRTGESVWVGELSGTVVHIVHQAAPPDDMVQPLDGDSAIPWHACALGQAIVASLDDDDQETILAAPAQRLTGLTVTDPEGLRQMLAMTRARGYAVEAHAATLGEAGIAAPLFDAAGQAVGAIGIVGDAERLLSVEQQNLADAVCATARALSQDAGAGSATRPAGG